MEEKFPDEFIHRDEHYARINELLASNNEYLARARDAEAKLATLLASSGRATDAFITACENWTRADALLRDKVDRLLDQLGDNERYINVLQAELEEIEAPLFRVRWWQFWRPVESQVQWGF